MKENLITKLVTNYVPDGGTEKRFVFMGLKNGNRNKAVVTKSKSNVRT